MTDRVAITDRVEQVLAILAVSGLVPSQFGLELLIEVDSGEILMANSTESTYDVDENIKLLRCISIELWTDYLNSSLRF